MTTPPWLTGGGEMGALIRSIDWAKTPVGPPEIWPSALRTMIGVLLTSQHPMFIYWGRDLVQFYNDAYRPILGSKKHPAAMGQLGRECWTEVWEILEPMMAKVWDGGATHVKDGQLVLDRHGFLEECYFDYAYTPIRDEHGEVAGIFVPCGETTGRILGERRLQVLGELSARTSQAKDPDEVCAIASDVLARAAADLPFALIYLRDDDHGDARLAGQVGFAAEPPAQAWPFDASRAAPVEVALDGGFPGGLWPEPATRAVVLALARPDGEPCGYLVAGTSPRLDLDDAYRRFLRLVAGHVSSAVQNARAHADQRLRADKLAELDRAKTTFFSNVSHELRTPLALILGPTERMLDAPELPPVLRPELEVVTRNARTLLAQVNDLLDVARLEAGKATVAYAHVDLAALARVAASHFEVLAADKRIELVIDAPDAVAVEADAAKLQRVVLNLLGNAFKFTPEGGTIRCAVGRDGDAAVVEVADSGPGIPAAEREAVFERFRQLDGGATRRFGGTGLGLAIAREFAELHRGALTVSTAPEGGARFELRIPRRAPAGVEVAREAGGDPGATVAARAAVDALRPATSAPGAEPATATATVLVVEDNPEMNQFIRGSLGGGYRYLVAGDGVEGLHLALESSPDLIVTDVMMPRMSGDQLVREVRGHRELDAVPILVLTARTDDALRIELLRAGAQDFVTKPFSAEELRARAHNLVVIKRARQALQHELASQDDDLVQLSTEVGQRRRELEAALDQVRRSAELQRFLATATAMLAELHDPKRTLSRVAGLAVPLFADWCVIDLAGDDRTYYPAEIAHADPAEAVLAERLREYPAIPHGTPDHPTTRALLDGAPVLIEDLADADLPTIAQDARHHELLAAIGVRSVISAPMIAHGHTVGVLTCWLARSDRRYGLAERGIAQDLARRCALALDNARLFHEVKAAVQARDEFLSIASHELRTPLTPLMLQLHTLRERIDEFVKVDKQAWLSERLTTIERQTSRLEALISEVLDISRIAAGRLPIDLDVVDLAAVIPAVIDDLRMHKLVERSHSELTVRTDPQIVGRWDRARLEQVVFHLVGNALKFGGGKPIVVTATADDAVATLVVRDHGPGIAPADQARVFGRFERAVSARHYGGLGLGLFLVRHVVEAMGGEIAVTSAPGEGATFTVTLPLIGPREVGPSPASLH